MALDHHRSALAARTGDWTPLTLAEFLTSSAAEFGDRPFVVTDDRTFTYADIDAWATRLGDGLAALGVVPGDRVGLLLANYPAFVPLKFAIARAGAVAIPFNFLYQRDELEYVLGQSRCSTLITMTSFGGLDQIEMLDEISPGWTSAGGGSALPELRQVVVVPTDDRNHDEALTIDRLDALGAANPGAADASQVSPDDPGDILYTSGTTGSPKGVVVTHDAVRRTAFASAMHRGFEDGRRVLFSLPCYHMFGYVEGLLAAMIVGGSIVPRLTFDPADYLGCIERYSVDDILAVPTMTIALVEHPDRTTRDLSSVRAILSGAAPAPVWLWETVQTELGIDEITTGYGMTECGGAMTLTDPEDALEIHATRVGTPKTAGPAGLSDRNGDLCEYRTADPTTGGLLPLGTEGELISRGPTHMLEYWEKPAETAEALADGWLHSGDLGIVHDDGSLELTGRSKELYKSGGELVMPKEIEELVSQHRGVSQAYAVGVPDDRWGEIGCVFVVAEPGAEIDPDELVERCRANLAKFKVPRHVLPIEAGQLPTTPTGKVQKFKLVDLAIARLKDR